MVELSKVMSHAARREVHHKEFHEKLSKSAAVASDSEASIEKVSLDYDPDEGKTPEERKELDRKLMRRLDWVLMPWLCFLYLISFLDRANIGNAKVEGLGDDLGLHGTQYNLCLTIFFISYSVFEPLSNVLLKRFKPRVFIPAIMTAWGLTMCFMGFVHNFSGLMAARWFLGLTEAGLFPGINYYLSCWYKRQEFGIRAAIFFSSAAISGSFGGLLAAAIAKMHGIGGKAGWAWIFIIEGGITVLVGIASYWIVQDFPAEATFLSNDDKARVLRRLKEDKQASSAHEEFKSSFLMAAITDWKTWVSCLIYMGIAGPLYAFSMFLPSIILELGYSASNAQLLSVPPYVLACMLTITVGYYADKWNKRGIWNMTVPLISIVGFTILLAAPSSAPAGLFYFATFLGAMGIYPCIANTITWMSNNVEGVYKRGLVMGIFMGWGNLNGVMSSNVYRAVDTPRYTLGHAVCLAYLVVGAWGGSILLYFGLKRENAQKRNGQKDYLIEGKTEVEIEALGDKKPDFMYTL